MYAYDTTRYRCEYCRKSYARKGSAAAHEAECHRNPAVRACTTCKHFTPDGPWHPFNECAVDGFLTMRDYDGTGQGPLDCFEKHCPMWEVA